MASGRKSVRVRQLSFSDHSLAVRVREAVLNLLVPFDTDQDLQFDEQEISNALMGILNENKS